MMRAPGLLVSFVLAAIACGRYEHGTSPDWGALLSRERVLAESDARHQPWLEAGVPHLGDARLGADGARLGSLAIGLVALGRDGDVRELERTGDAASVVGAEVRIERAPGVTEWWRSLALGLEQGVTFETRPPGDGALVLEMSAGPGVRASMRTDDEIVLADAGGRELARYAHLVVTDAGGRRIPGHMGADGDRIRIEVDDADARYPLVVDPLVVATHEATFRGPSTTPEVGTDVSMSADGTRALVVAGAEIIVFARSGTSWAVEDRFDANPPVAAMSADGRFVAASGPSFGLGVHIRSRSGTAWTETATIPMMSTVDAMRLDATGSVLLVGIAGGNGEARVFSRTGTAWVQEASLAPSGVLTPGTGFGAAVALSGDGLWAAIGAPTDFAPSGIVVPGAGAVWLYANVGAGWIGLGVFGPEAGGTSDRFGCSVALDGTGEWLVVGAEAQAAPGGPATGRAELFHRSGMAWTRADNWGPSDPAPGQFFGHSVSISDDGTLALIGAPVGRIGAAGGGTVRAFVRDAAGTSWVPSITFRAPSTLVGDRFGEAVALSGDRTRAIVGAPDADDGASMGAGFVSVFRIAPASTLGSACGSTLDCLSGFCADGVCCDEACVGPCVACSVTAGGPVNGMCILLNPSTVCRPAVDGCDADDLCDTGSSDCGPDLPRAAGAECRAVAGLCDAPETCDGTSFSCPADGFIDAVECRPPAGACDAPELCFGTSASCPPDVVLSAGVSCRTPTNPTCDPQESCNGVAADCPADVTMCALPDGGGAGDAGALADSGAAPPAAPINCGCRTSGTRAPASAFLVMLCVAGLARRRRR